MFLIVSAKLVNIGVLIAQLRTFNLIILNFFILTALIRLLFYALPR